MNNGGSIQLKISWDIVQQNAWEPTLDNHGKLHNNVVHIYTFIMINNFKKNHFIRN